MLYIPDFPILRTPRHPPVSQGTGSGLVITGHGGGAGTGRACKSFTDDDKGQPPFTACSEASHRRGFADSAARRTRFGMFAPVMLRLRCPGARRGRIPAARVLSLRPRACVSLPYASVVGCIAFSVLACLVVSCYSGLSFTLHCVSFGDMQDIVYSHAHGEQDRRGMSLHVHLITFTQRRRQRDR